MENVSSRKLALTVFFASVVINAALGIFSLFAGEFGDLQGKVLMTSLSVSAASVLSLAMFPAKERELLGPVPTVGIALSVLGFGMLVVLVWTDFNADDFGRLVASVLTFAVAAGYASLIALAVVQPKFRNIVNAAFGLAAVLSVLIVGALWAEPRGDFMLRLMGILSILLAAATVSIPVLHRLNRSEISVDESIAELEYTHVFLDRQPSICLNCGDAGIDLAEDGTYECESCDARFRVEIPG